MGKVLGLDTSSNMGRLIAEKYASTIHDNYDMYFGKDYERNYIEVRNTIADYIQPGSLSYVLLFDGTGDLTFVNKPNKLHKFNVLTYDNKYNCKVNLNIIPFKGVKRTISSFTEKEEIKMNLINSLYEVENIIRRNNKTLIVTWKNFKKGSEIDYLDNDEEVKSVVSNYLDTRALSGKYEIIHYMSGLDKATNQFKDFDSVVFLGKFQVPDKVIEQFNIDYWSNTDRDKYTLYQLVQAICRTRIRKHNGEGINVYFSEDWNKNIIESVRKYMGNGTIDINSSSRILTNKIKGKLSSSILELMRVYPKIKNSIESDTQYDLILTLDEIYKIIPKSQKKVKEYYPLINALRKIGINLTITSERRGRFSNKEE
jgi:NifU-like protein involved in Fe-S cluster formation